MQRIFVYRAHGFLISTCALQASWSPYKGSLQLQQVRWCMQTVYLFLIWWLYTKKPKRYQRPDMSRQTSTSMKAGICAYVPFPVFVVLASSHLDHFASTGLYAPKYSTTPLDTTPSWNGDN